MKFKTFGKAVLGVALLGVGMAWAAEWKFVNLNVPTQLQAVTNATVTNYTGTALQLTPNTVYTFVLSATGTSTNTQPVIYGFDFSPDNTNWSYSDPIKYTNTLVSGSNSITAKFDTTPSGNCFGQNWLRFDYLGCVAATAITNGPTSQTVVTSFPGSFWY